MKYSIIYSAILLIAATITMTSCNRQNVPEFAAGRFHHHEKDNRQTSMASSGTKHNDNIQPILPKKQNGFTSAFTDTKLKPISTKTDFTVYSSNAVKNKNKRIVAKKMPNENQGITEAVLRTGNPILISEVQKKTPAFRPDGSVTSKALCAIISIFIPFLGVGLYEGIHTDFWIDLILCLFFWLPGIIFALIVILSD